MSIKDFFVPRLDYSRKSKSNLHTDNPFIYSVSVLHGEENQVLAQGIVCYSLVAI